MKVTVVGKSHRAGTSKTGKDYDFTTIMAEYDMRADGYNSGLQVDRINVDARLMPYALIVVGAMYDLDFDRNGFLLGIEEV